jgi:hypothetical protein
MPPAMLWQAGTPCSRSQCATFKLRTPWWQKTINAVSSALASSCCKLAGMSRMGIKVAPSMRVMANSSGSRTSISTIGSPASIRRWISSGLASIGRIASLTNLRIAQSEILVRFQAQAMRPGSRKRDEPISPFSVLLPNMPSCVRPGPYVVRHSCVYVWEPRLLGR